MVASRTFTSMRAGLEATRGTSVLPTRGIDFTTGVHLQNVGLIYPQTLRNSRFTHFDGDAEMETNALEFTGNVRYNQIIWWLNHHVKGLTTPTGAGADRTWTFLPAATDDIKTSTIQFAMTDAISATVPGWQVPYVIGDTFSLNYQKTTGSPGVTFASRLVSPKGATQISALTGVGTYTAEAGGLVKAQNTQVSIDTTTIGTTADNDIVSIEWNLQGQPFNLETLNNTAVAQDTFLDSWAWTARVRRYYRNDTELDAFVAKTIRKIRVRTLGPVLGGSNFKIDLDLYGKYGPERTVTEQGPLKIEEYTLNEIYDATLGASFQVVVVNDQTTLT